ncbi:FAD-binding oxidoreductase [Pseudoduganella sp. SL102]|uniref:FAD-binding oxidoreductase n=1 Tax=Pseudoduganella sp. SL102 TaxID=2995154 RepID=UPI00248D1EF0|nr:FAD-binding oxidoreductase [Pseudoduganella sp. SL102]WBS04978.1 FAD-binding oxidoreductase [Pseudoduganella sp. SL102]
MNEGDDMSAGDTGADDMNANNTGGVDSAGWQTAVISRIEPRTARMRSYYLRAPLARHAAGQHVDVRLTAPDGYQARRSYSIASAPGADAIELAIEMLDEGEVSAWFHEVAQAGDSIGVRGPLGGHFVWPAEQPGSILLVAGGSGVVPLVSIARAWRDAGAPVPALLLHSARSWDGLAYREELRGIATAYGNFSYLTTVTRDGGAAADHTRRIDRAMIAEALARLADVPGTCYVCGANGFVETAAQLLVAAGIAPRAIRTERYGG